MHCILKKIGVQQEKKKQPCISSWIGFKTRYPIARNISEAIPSSLGQHATWKNRSRPKICNESSYDSFSCFDKSMSACLRSNYIFTLCNLRQRPKRYSGRDHNDKTVSRKWKVFQCIDFWTTKIKPPGKISKKQPCARTQIKTTLQSISTFRLLVEALPLKPIFSSAENVSSDPFTEILKRSTLNPASTWAKLGSHFKKNEEEKSNQLFRNNSSHVSTTHNSNSSVAAKKSFEFFQLQRAREN